MWFTGKITTLEDCHIVLVYLGGGTFHYTILKSAKPCFQVGKPSTSQEPVDSDYVYNPESPFGSPVPCRHTRSMGTPPLLPSKSGASGSSMEPAESSDSLDEPDGIPLRPPKPKHCCCRRRKPIAIKEKTYRIHHGSRHTQKWCSLCKEKFPSQKELNVHVSSVHTFQFLCKSRKYGKKFSSQAALDKHELIHKGPHFFWAKCGDGILFNYQLKNHANTHTDFVIKCPYPRCGKLYKSEGEYRTHKKVHQTYQEYACTTCGKKFTEKKYRDEHLAIHSKELKNECPKCGKKYMWHSSLAKHMTARHPPTPRPTPDRSSSPEY